MMNNIVKETVISTFVDVGRDVIKEIKEMREPAQIAVILAKGFISLGVPASLAIAYIAAAYLNARTSDFKAAGESVCAAAALGYVTYRVARGWYLEPAPQQ
ncbi:MAG: hypothetical protein WC521_07075 [Bdellovibrionales bacterium]